MRRPIFRRRVTAWLVWGYAIASLVLVLVALLIAR
jgi:hypothetical protein